MAQKEKVVRQPTSYKPAQQMQTRQLESKIPGKQPASEVLVPWPHQHCIEPQTHPLEMDTHLKIEDLFETIVKGNLAKFHAIVTRHKLDASIISMRCNSCYCQIHPQYRPIFKEETGNPLEVAIRLQKYEIVRYMLNNMMIPVTRCIHMM
jgi:hypothetical protein